MFRLIIVISVNTYQQELISYKQEYELNWLYLIRQSNLEVELLLNVTRIIF